LDICSSVVKPERSHPQTYFTPAIARASLPVSDELRPRWTCGRQGLCQPCGLLGLRRAVLFALAFSACESIMIPLIPWIWVPSMPPWWRPFLVYRRVGPLKRIPGQGGEHPGPLLRGHVADTICDQVRQDGEPACTVRPASRSFMALYLDPFTSRGWGGGTYPRGSGVSYDLPHAYQAPAVASISPSNIKGLAILAP
jgi:hypothetical protein